MTSPYYADEAVTLYHGDCREVLPTLDLTVDACVADPPYGITTAEWDHWQDGWTEAVGAVLPASASLWCFGTASVFLRHAGEFAGWKFGQEALWLKRTGSGPGSSDRLLVVHEWAYHWYRGRWSDLHHEWEREPYVGPEKGYVRSVARGAAHQRDGRAYAWHDDGTRQPHSVRVTPAPSVRHQKRHQDEKPVKVTTELVRECTPLGGTVLDPFAGSGTTAVAAKMCGRRAVLVEANERDCEGIARRLAQDVLPLGATP